MHHHHGLLIPLFANAHWAMHDWRIASAVDLSDQHNQRNNDLTFRCSNVIRHFHTVALCVDGGSRIAVCSRPASISWISEVPRALLECR
ncbi:hypothetical protein EV702DRAFT_1034585 [Suillus placidus]|uniref:Uncharacterized protein n=1 Tax=Suillus placidus TaxID=48579 RepID=A0A9P6ZKV6_9AGAM|nr:hypothetical protein EV702DRAFT_1034585 [Suillus placidus]